MDHSTISIRRAALDDANFLTDLGERTFLEAFGSRMAAPDIRAHIAKTYSVNLLASELADPRSIFLIASIGKEASGYAALVADARHECIEDASAMEIKRFYALKKFWGRDVGAALMERCLDTARRKEYSTIWLSSWKLNDRANVFYRKWGFEAVGEQLFVVGDDVQEDFIMARSLAARDRGRRQRVAE